MLRIEEQYRRPSSPIRNKLETSLKAVHSGVCPTPAVLARTGKRMGIIDIMNY
jgi:hypothetical protein